MITVTGKHGRRYRWNAPIDYDSVAFCGAGLFPESGDLYHDAGPGRRDGACLGMDGTQWGQSRDIERAYCTFDNTNDYVSVPYNAAFDVGATFSLHAWIYLAATPRDYSQILDHETVSAGWSFIVHSDRKLHFWTSASNNWTLCASSSAMAVNQWYSVCAVLAGGSATVYINGAAASSPTSLPTPGAASNPLLVGYNCVGYTRWFNGRISDPLVVRGALATDQIAWLADPSNRLVVPLARRSVSRRPFRPAWARNCNQLIGV